MSLENFYEHSLKSGVFLLLLLGCGHAASKCTNRRCLAEELVKKAALSQPQEIYCRQTIDVINLEYQTVSVDTKNLLLHVRLTLTLGWEDPTLAWNKSEYNIHMLSLPVRKIWTPEIRVANGIRSAMEHCTQDVVVDHSGRMQHDVMITAEVNCALNMFNFPFAADGCPVGIRSWTTTGCGTELHLPDNITMVDSSRGEWETTSVVFQELMDEYAQIVPYILVSLKIRHFNAFITVMLPSILIVLVDVVSFFLPLRSGERNGFKVTLVLSLVVLLTILDEKLPGGSECSPVIRLHYCVCMVLLVVSMLVSMVLTGMAKDGVALCRCAKMCASKTGGDETDKEDEETKGSADEEQDLRDLPVTVLLGAEEKQRRRGLANTLDQIFFWLYLMGTMVYFCAMICVMVTYRCKVAFDPFYWAHTL